MDLTKSDRELLFRVARGAIQAHLDGQRPPQLTEIPPSLRQPQGVFVTLHRQGRLRGCIGFLEAVKPLAEAVQEMAVNAAFRDPRFPPLRAEEMAEIDLEISALSPMRRIDKVEEIEVGKHGLFIQRGMYRGLLLPQVATEYKWDRLTFLEHTCGKAGLPPDAWKDPATRIDVFTAEIFSEQPGKPGCLKQESKAP